MYAGDRIKKTRVCQTSVDATLPGTTEEEVPEAAQGWVDQVAANGLKAEGFAVGEQNGVPVEEGSDYYNNNAKYFAESIEGDVEAAETAATNAINAYMGAQIEAAQAETAKTGAQTAATSATASATSASADATLAGNSATAAANAKTAAEAAQTAAETAETNAEAAETNAETAQAAAEAAADRAETAAASVGDLPQRVTAIEDNEPRNVTYEYGTEGKGVYYNKDGEMSSAISTIVDYVDVSGINKLSFSRRKNTNASSNAGMAFYDADKAYISGIRDIKGADQNGYVMEDADVPEGAKYARFTAFLDTETYGDFVLKKYTKLQEAIANAGGGGELMGEEPPKGYKRLRYAKAGSSQPYVYATANDVVSSQKSRVKARVRLPELSPDVAQRFFGSRKTTSSRGFTTYIGNNKNNFCAQYGDTEVNYVAEPNFGINKKLEVHEYELNAGKAYIDGVLAHEWASTTFTTEKRPLWGAIQGSSSTIYRTSNMELYELEYWADGTGAMTSHLLPYEREADGVIGWYDHVTGTFLTPIEGTFESGGYLNISENANRAYRDRIDLLNYVDSHSGGGEQVPKYIEDEAERVSIEARKHQAPNALTWVAISDCHALTDDENASLKDMADAVQLIREQLAVDMCMSHGDIIYRMSGYTDYDAGVDEAQIGVKAICKAFGNHPQIRMVGNHDANCANGSKWFPVNELNAYAGAFTNVDGFVPGGTGYGYIDIQRAKVRLIVLNTTWYDADTHVSGTTWYDLDRTQAQWFCGALDMSDKSDASDWGIIVMSHVPLDTTSSNMITRWDGIMDAYQAGSAYSKTVSGAGTVSYDFTGKNAAKIIAHIAGHAHKYFTSAMINTGTSTAYPVMRVLIPNVLAGRDYASDDDITYTKTPGTKDSTSFCVNVLDRVEKVIHSVHYGAGFDRVCHYEAMIVTAGGTVTLTSAVGDTWQSADTGVCTVSNGVVTGVAAGSTTVRCRNSTTADQEVWLVVVG